MTDTAPVLERVADFAGLLRGGEDEVVSALLRRAETVGRPLGDGAFMDWIAAQLGRNAEPGKRGRPKQKK